MKKISICPEPDVHITNFFPSKAELFSSHPKKKIYIYKVTHVHKQKVQKSFATHLLSNATSGYSPNLKNKTSF